MKQNEVIKRIREYHIIKSIMGSDSVKRLIAKKDPKVAGVLAVYDSYTEFFGGIRIDSTEDFDRFFRRLENNYLAGGKTKVSPTEEGYQEYLRSVLGTANIDKLTTIMSEPDTQKRIVGLFREVGGKTRESNAVVVAKSVKEYSVVSGLRGNLTEAQRHGRDVESELEKVRLVLKLTKDKTLTIDQIMAALTAQESRIIAAITAAAAGNERLIRAMDRTTGRKLDQIYSATGRLEAGVSGLAESVERVEGKVDDISTKLDKKSKSTAITTGIVSGVGGIALGAGVMALVFSLLSGNPATQTPTVVGNEAYDAYIASAVQLDESVYSKLSDGSFSEEDKKAVLAEVEAFIAQYATGDFKDESEAKAKTIKAMAEYLFNMEDTEEIKAFLTASQSLSSSIHGKIFDQDGLTADDKTAIIEEIDKYEDKYVSTIYKDASAAVAQNYEAMVNGLFASGTSLTAYNGYKADYIALSTTLQEYATNPATLDEQAKNDFIAQAEELKTKYASSEFAGFAEVGSNNYKSLMNNLYETVHATPSTPTNPTNPTKAHDDYIAGYAKLSTSLKDYLADGVFNQKDRDDFIAELEAFEQAHSTTQFAALASDAKVVYSTIADSLLTMSNSAEGKALLEQYRKDYMTMEEALRDFIADGNFTAKDKSDFASLVDVFEGKYEATPLKTVAENDAAVISAVANSIDGMQIQIDNLDKGIKDLKAKIETLFGMTAGTYTDAQLEAIAKQFKEAMTDLDTYSKGLDELIAEYNGMVAAGTPAEKLAAVKDIIQNLEKDLNTATVEAANLVFDIAEMLTGQPQTDINVAMAIVMDGLGITPTTPSTGENKPTGPQPEK